MSLIRLLPAWFHAIADYAVGAPLIIVALAVGGSTGAVATGVVVGAVVLVVSMLTSTHSASRRSCPSRCTRPATTSPRPYSSSRPFALNFRDSDPGLSVFYIVPASRCSR